MRYGFKNAEEVKEASLKYNLHSWSVQGKLNPAVVEKAEGIYYYTADGKKMADMSSQLVNLHVGYGNKDIIDAIKEQAEKLAYISPAYAIDCRSKLAEMVVKVAPKNMGKVFFTLGGADANENAIKIAKLVTGRYKIFSRYRAYHGSSFGAGNLTGEPRRYTLEPGIPGFVKFTDPYLYHAPFPFESEEQATEYYLGQLRDQIIYENPDAVAAVVMESVTGSNGIIIPPKGYLQGVRKICDEFGIMMVCDEVMAGWGRTGEYFACENWGIEPDMITFAKENEGAGLSEFLEQVALVSDMDSFEADDDKAVLMTMHSAKGLEFDTVFVVGAEENIFPGYRSQFDPMEIEEERRLAYVAITRAKRHLYFTCAKQRMLYGQTMRNKVSRFVVEKPSQYMAYDDHSAVTASAAARSAEQMKPRTSYLQQQQRSYRAGQREMEKRVENVSYAPGERVRHGVFGDGTVLSAKAMGGDWLLEIAFDDKGTKKVAAKFAKMTKI